eukprot:4957896-Prymnesium_polylepis.1
MSGRIHLAPSPPSQWTPQFPLRAAALDHMIEREKRVFIFFWSSATEHIGDCRTLGLEFEKAVNEMFDEEDATFSVGMVNLNAESSAGEAYGEKGGLDFDRPTIKLFRVSGRAAAALSRTRAHATTLRMSRCGAPRRASDDARSPRYLWQDGGRDGVVCARGSSAAAIAAWMREQTGAPTQQLRDAKQLDALLAESAAPVVVGVFAAGSKAQSKTPSGIARGHFVASAERMRGTMTYVEVSARTANAAQAFNANAPFEPTVCAFAL